MRTKPGDWDNVDESLVQLAAALELTINSLNNSFTFEDGSELFPTAAHRSYGTQRLTNRQRNSNWLAKLSPDWNPYVSLRLTRRPNASVAVPLTDIIQRNINRLHANAMSEKSSRSKSRSRSSSKKKTRNAKGSRSHSPVPSSSSNRRQSVNFHPSESDDESVLSDASFLAGRFQRSCSTINTTASLGYEESEVTYLDVGPNNDGVNTVVKVTNAKDKVHSDKSKQTDLVQAGWCILRALGEVTKFHTTTGKVIENVAYKDGRRSAGIELLYKSNLPSIKKMQDQLLDTVHRMVGYVNSQGYTPTQDTPFIDGLKSVLVNVPDSDSDDEGDLKKHLFVLAPVQDVFPDAPADASWGNNYFSSHVKSDKNPKALNLEPDTISREYKYKDPHGVQQVEDIEEHVLMALLSVDKTEVATEKEKKKNTAGNSWGAHREKTKARRALDCKTPHDDMAVDSPRSGSLDLSISTSQLAVSLDEESKGDTTEENNDDDDAAAAAAAAETLEGEAEKETEEKKKAVGGRGALQALARLATLRRGRAHARQGNRSPSEFSGSRSRSRDRCGSNSSDESGTNTESVEMTTPLMAATYAKEETKGLKGFSDGKKAKVVVEVDGNEHLSMDFVFDNLNQDRAPTSLSAAASEVAKGTYNSPPAKNLKRD